MPVSDWFLSSGIAGWIAVILLMTAALLPYVLRRAKLAGTLRSSERGFTAYLARMRPHIWIGYGATILAYLHAYAAMHLKISAAAWSGLSLAMVAESLLVLQVIVGLALMKTSLSSRKTLRRVHFWTMGAIVITAAGHIAMSA